MGAGFLGAGLTAAVMLMSLVVLFFLGFLSIGRKSKDAVHARSASGSDSGSEVSTPCLQFTLTFVDETYPDNSPTLCVRLR